MIPIMITSSEGAMFYPAIYKSSSKRIRKELSKITTSSKIIQLKIIYEDLYTLTNVHSVLFYDTEIRNFVRWV